MISKKEIAAAIIKKLEQNESLFSPQKNEELLWEHSLSTPATIKYGNTEMKHYHKVLLQHHHSGYHSSKRRKTRQSSKAKK